MTLAERAKAFCEKDEWNGQTLEDALIAFAALERELIADELDFNFQHNEPVWMTTYISELREEANQLCVN